MVECSNMKLKQILKILTDILLTAALLLLMSYELIGAAVHEWLGIGMFVLFVLHHILNGGWTRNIMRGRYAPFRAAQTVLVVPVLFSMLGSMVSGVILSRHALSFLPIKGGLAFARKLHMISGYWGFVFMSLHLGFHWSVMIGMAKKLVKNPCAALRWIMRAVAVLIAGYGIYAFGRRDIGSYMFLKNQFVFFDYEEPLYRFMLDYIAVMGLFVCVGHYFSKLMRYKPSASTASKI